MVEVDTAKMKRRIKRFIKTGKHQARVYQHGNSNIFEYRAKHHARIHLFKSDKLGRLRKVK